MTINLSEKELAIIENALRHHAEALDATAADTSMPERARSAFEADAGLTLNLLDRIEKAQGVMS